MIREPSRFPTARHMAMPLAVFAVVAAVTLIARAQLLQILADADRVRFSDERIRIGKPLTDHMNVVFEIIDVLRRQQAKGDPLSVEDEEWKQRVPFAFDFGFARRVRRNGKEAFVIEHVESRSADAPHRPGDDLAEQPAIRQGIIRSLEGTRPDASAYVDAYGRRCTVFLSPVYRDNKRPTSPGEAEEALQGMAFATVDTFMVYADASKSFSPLLDFRLMNEGEADVREPMIRTVGIGVNGYVWRVLCKPGAAFYQVPQHKLPSVQLIGGLVFGLALAAWQLRQRIMLDRIIASRTAELVNTNERLELALAREQEVSEMKSNFISTVSHEFRTPLGVILSSNGILKNYLDRLTAEKRAEHFEAIGKAVSRMTEMVEDVLLFSRAEANRLDFNPRPTDVLGFISIIVDEVNSATDQKCVIDIVNNGLPAAAMLDEKLLRPILRNLLENAVKYSPPSSVITLTSRTADDRLIFDIEDHGIGIPQPDLKRLGEAFVRAKNALDIKGTGLGLAIVQRCVHRHGGTLKITSHEGIGTTARVDIPLVVPPPKNIKTCNEEDPCH